MTYETVALDTPAMIFTAESLANSRNPPDILALFSILLWDTLPMAAGSSTTASVPSGPNLEGWRNSGLRLVATKLKR